MRLLAGGLLWLVMGIASAYENRLYTPTFVTRIEGRYFIVDCWHHRILHSARLDTPLERWESLDDDLAGPHSIAFDGRLYVVDNTGRHEVVAFRRDGRRFVRVDSFGFPDGRRPHRVVYDRGSKRFFVVFSDSQHLAVFRREKDRLALESYERLDFLKGAYTRGLTVIDGELYFTSGADHVSVAAYRDGRARLRRHVPGVPGMNDIFPLPDGRFVVTATPKHICIVADRTSFRGSGCDEVYRALGMKGTPYYLSVVDGRIVIPEIGYSAVSSFRWSAGGLASKKVWFDSGPATPQSVARRVSRSL